MSLEILTYNTQRDYSQNVVPAIGQLIQEHPEAILCLQEVTESMWWRIRAILPKWAQFFHCEENALVVPRSVTVSKFQSLTFGLRTRTFLQTDIIWWAQETVSIVTGKLRHGLSPLERFSVLWGILSHFSHNPSILALDTNHLLPFESRIALWLLQRYGFSYTENPGGTHDMHRMEDDFFEMIPEWFIRKQLDRIFFSSSDFQLQESYVKTGIKASDHEPVFALLSRKLSA